MKPLAHPKLLARNLPLSVRLGAVTAALVLALLPALQAAVPADPAVEFRFQEGPADAGGNGVTTTNSGSLGGLGTFAQPVDPLWETNLYPAFSTNVPGGTYVPAANDYSVYFGPIIGNSLGGSHGRAVDLAPDVSPGFGSIGAFPKLTVCGWVNASTLAAGGGGNRIAFALESPGGLGFDLVQRASGQLSLIINQYNDGSPESSPGVITADANMSTNNWVFFAATYDPSLPSEQVKYYFGRHNKLAALDVARDYTPPTASVDFTGILTLGNFGTVEGARDAALGGNSRIYRGMLDEIKVYTNAFTLDEVQQAQLNSVVPAIAASFLKEPVSVIAPAGANATFTCEASGSGLITYQWRTNGVAVTGATNQTFIWNNVQVADSGTAVSVLIDNVPLVDPGLVSSNAILTVISADPKIASFSFSATSGILTPNLGSFAGAGRLKLVSALPVITTTNVPTGPNAPSATHNRDALFMGSGNGAHRAVDMTNNLISPVGKLGSMNALTICGWLNSGNHTFRTASTGRGTAIVNASLGGTSGGFVLGYRNNGLNATYGENGRLQFHVNEWNTDGTLLNLSSVDTVPLNTNLPPENWVYFAVTYDGQSTTDNLKFYFGNANQEANLDVTQTYNKGVIADTGPLAIGNHNAMIGDINTPMSGNPLGRNTGSANGTMWRGLLDEIKIFNKVLTVEEIRAQQVLPALPTLLVYSNSGPNLDLSWETPLAYPYQLQSRTNLGTGSWINVTDPETVSGNVHKVTVPRDEAAEFFRITR
jgi:hypothetical protein